MNNNAGEMKGRKFGRLTVLKFAGNNVHRKKVWQCLCDCGALVVVVGSSLRSSNTESCGCLHKEKITTHGQSGGGTTIRSRTYRTWMGMLQRCNNPNNPDYGSYGGRGIQVCDEWVSYQAFLTDMGECPSEQHSIDRFPDNDGNYAPHNCRWATKKQQDRNKRTNHLITYNGEVRCLTEWAELLELSPITLDSRLRAGQSVEEAFFTPVRSRK